jgi:hypothetical protein
MVPSGYSQNGAMVSRKVRSRYEGGLLLVSPQGSGNFSGKIKVTIL